MITEHGRCKMGRDEQLGSLGWTSYGTPVSKPSDDETAGSLYQPVGSAETYAFPVGPGNERQPLKLELPPEQVEEHLAAAGIHLAYSFAELQARRQEVAAQIHTA